LPSPTHGWIDLETCIIYRKGTRARDSKKRRTPCRIHARLLRHLRYWRQQDMAAGITHVISYEGERIADNMRRSWLRVRQEASKVTGKSAPLYDGKPDGPHVMRHTAATWMRKKGVPTVEAASYLGMSVETYERVYAHLAPDFQAKAASW